VQHAAILGSRQGNYTKANDLLSIRTGLASQPGVRSAGRQFVRRLHSLTGDLKGFYSSTVNGDWRVMFRFVELDAELVDCVA
jgi:mRNA-degrading endonuclease YafQ of YafQ-DinJ toxin-antitoxin module